MKKYLSVILTALLLISIPAAGWCETENQTANQHREIEASVNLFYDSVEQYDAEAFLGVLTPEVAQNVRDGHYEENEIYDVANIVIMGSEDPEDMPVFSFKNRNITIQEQTENTAVAIFQADIVLDEHDPENMITTTTADTLRLNLVDGRWLISSLSTDGPTEQEPIE